MKIGDLVKYKGKNFQDWLGYIVKEFPGHSEVKMIHWWHAKGGKDRSTHPADKLEVVSEGR